MARDPNNNPTERICNLLSEMEALEWAHGQLFAIASELTDASILAPFTRPNLEAFAAEKVRQGRNYRGPRPEIMRQRLAQERLRARGGSVKQLNAQAPAGGPYVTPEHFDAVPLLSIETEKWEAGKKLAQEIIDSAKGKKDEG